ncbi:methyl-accepting chemotaxis protein [Agrobacterium vitis]|nr:methyl-accepting chemotaxis protein [Agrobacterium vitis]WEO75084.1 methyl-accepting chemotaxis protein [Agrobacterium vitis]
MNALDKIRQKSSIGILVLLWINVALIILRNLLRSEGVDLATVVTAIIMGTLASVLWNSDRTGPTTRVVTSMAHAASVAILVFSFSGSPLQIDMHMYFFANLAICAVWVDWRAILAYAAFVSVHHILLFFVSSLAVFPEGSDFSRVVLHAAILIVETGVLFALVYSLISALESAEAAMDQAKTAQEVNAEMALRAKEADLEMEAERQRVSLQAEAAAQKRLQEATDGLAKGLRRLAAGDLAFQINIPFSSEFEALRHDLNTAVKQLGGTLHAIVGSVGAIDTGSNEISHAAGDLSKRTEQQAASLEQTAAALDEITVNVANSTKRAEEARVVAAQANASASDSGVVVASAVDAMRKIEESSNQVSNIIGVIDEIAFQTNLLALNAGVEAARAGDAGKGFAVVAQEVRELAQRSAQAAREIKELIRSSSIEVQSGVKLVRETGAALKTIENYIVTVNEHMNAIATSSREQSTGLAEVNTAINQLDQVTQQNAAMVEETTAAGAALASETNTLRALIEQFQLDAKTSVQASARQYENKAA